MLYGAVLLLNLLVWGIAWATYHRFPISLSLCFLAYGFGLKHGLDADHITAIDNVTRKLVQKHYQPTTIGFYFSLGHSTVVILLSLVIVLTAHAFHHSFAALSHYGALFGTLFSSLFLLLFALINGITFFELMRKKDAKNRVSTCHPHHSEPSGGLLSRLFNPLFNMVNKSWHMFPVGFLFGLGFDTATEVALLGLSAYQATQALSLLVVLIFPILFTAGMCLIDTTGGLCMLGACQWACVNPARKRLYNLVITGISFITALLIGGYELLALLVPHKHSHFNTYLNNIDHHFTNIGLVIVFLMSITWLFSRYIAKQRAS